MKLTADQSKCLAYANCIAAAEDIFDLDDNALVIVLEPEPGNERQAAARRAAALCPVKAITVEE